MVNKKTPQQESLELLLGDIIVLFVLTLGSISTIILKQINNGELSNGETVLLSISYLLFLLYMTEQFLLRAKRLWRVFRDFFKDSMDDPPDADENETSQPQLTSKNEESNSIADQPTEILPHKQKEGRK